MSKKHPKCKDHILLNWEKEKLLKACKSKKEIFCLNLHYYTSLRVNEICHLNRSWIAKDFETLTIPERMRCDCQACQRIRYKTKRNKETKEVISRKIIKPAGWFMPKTGAGGRCVPIVPELRPILISFFKKHNSTREIFRNRTHVWRILQDVASRCHLEHKVFSHASRAGFACELSARGYSLPDVMSILGWQNPRILSTYIKLNQDHIKHLTQTKWVGGVKNGKEI